MVKKNKSNNIYYKNNEIFVLLLYIVCVSVISYFHEPWFDEAQAWQIARSASIKDILFKIPHWEGHPQLWHLLLVPFAKLGVPYLFSLKFVNIALCSTAVYVLLFKSPFPKILKYTLPFSYFIFYQYGVVSRPYCLVMLSMFLMASTYKNRDEKPLPFVLSMALLCASQMYGIIIAGMVSVVWVIKIFASHTGDKKAVFKDKRCYTLLGLFIFACILILSLLPQSDTYNPMLEMTVVERLKSVYVFFIIIFDAFWGMYISYDISASANAIIISAEALGGIIILTFLFYFGKKTKTLTECFVPMVTLLLFMTFGYSYPQHMGVITIYVIYYMWIMIDSNGTTVFYDLKDKINQAIDSNAIKRLVSIALALLLVLPISESVVSSIYEIKYPYTYSKDIADFIKDNNLQDLRIMSNWYCEIDYSKFSKKELKNLNFEQMKSARVDYPYMVFAATEMSPYFEKNLFMNLGDKNGNNVFTPHRATKDANKVFAEWEKKGLPDIIITEVELKMVYTEEELKQVEYVRVYTVKKHMIFKFTKGDESINLYMRKDLLDKYGLKELPF